jgi:hypothetical protein
MRYKVIEAQGEALNLKEEVNRQIEEGWAPFGGVAVEYSPQSYNRWFYQAMIKDYDRPADLPSR